MGVYTRLNMNEIEKLQKKIEDLESEILDLTTIINYSKSDELLEFVRELKESVEREINDTESSLTKEELLQNLKKHIADFTKYTKLDI